MPRWLRSAETASIGRSGRQMWPRLRSVSAPGCRACSRTRNQITLRRDFQAFLADLRRTLNRELQEEDVVAMIAQHLVTGPVFQALFADYDFVGSNPVSRALSRLVALLEAEGLENETRDLEPFYASVRQRAQPWTTPRPGRRCCWNSSERFSRWRCGRMRNAWALSTRLLKWWISFWRPRTMLCSSTLGGG